MNPRFLRYLACYDVANNFCQAAADGWASHTFPYGSEFNYDTTGQEEAGPARCRSPRHKMPFKSYNKQGSIIRIDGVAGNICQALMPLNSINMG